MVNFLRFNVTYMMRYNFAVLYFYIVLCPWVSLQKVSTDSKICSRDDNRNIEREVDYFVEIVKQQFIRIQELSEKVLAHETLLKNVSEKVFSDQSSVVEKRNENRTSISGQFGQEFILSFPYLRDAYDITLLLVSLTNATVTMHSLTEGVNRTVSFSASKGTSISLPTSLVSSGSYVTNNNTVSLHSDADVAVFVLITGIAGTGDGYLAIPRKRLNKKYFFSMNNYAVLSFVSFYDDTVITISNTTGKNFNFLSIRSDGSSNTIKLQKEEVVQLRLGGYMIGTVEGSKPFMVLHGSYSEYFNSAYSTSYIDSIPDSDGSLFIIPYLSTVSKYMTVCNAYESTTAHSDISVIKTHDKNYRILNYYNKATFIKLDLNTTCHYIGHGFSVTIPSVQSYATYCRFLTPSHHNYTHHAVVMIQSEFKDDMKFIEIEDALLVTPYKVENTTADGTMYDVLYYNIDIGQYEVYHEMSNAQFGVITYGFGTDQQIAYGYPVCCN